MMAKTNKTNQPKQKTKFNPIEFGKKAYTKFRGSKVYKAVRGLVYDRPVIEGKGYTVADMMELVDTLRDAYLTKEEYNRGAFNTYARLATDGKLDEMLELRGLHKDDATIQVNHPHYINGLGIMKAKIDEIEARAQGRTGKKKSTKKAGGRQMKKAKALTSN